MTTEQEKTEMVEQPENPQVEDVDIEKVRAELEATRKALKDANREAAERRKKLEALEKAEQDRKDAEMTELQKAQAELERIKIERDQLEQAKKAMELSQRKRAVADKIGLPTALADRLTGETEDEMEADAKTILEALPKGSLPKPGATNPGQNARGQTETDAERRKRLFG